MKIFVQFPFDRWSNGLQSDIKKILPWCLNPLNKRLGLSVCRGQTKIAGIMRWGTSNSAPSIGNNVTIFLVVYVGAIVVLFLFVVMMLNYVGR
jgi:hypothetical protein